MERAFLSMGPTHCGMNRDVENIGDLAAPLDFVKAVVTLGQPAQMVGSAHLGQLNYWCLRGR